MSNIINANRINNVNYIFECISSNSINIHPTQLIFCFLHLEKSTNCSRHNFISGPTIENIAKDINQLSDESLNHLAHILVESSSTKNETYNWINPTSKRQLHYLQNTIPLIVKSTNPLKFKNIKDISLYKFQEINEFTNLKIQLELNFPCREIESILNIARKNWIKTKDHDITIERWFNRDKNDIKTKFEATWRHFKNNKSHNENNVPPKEIEDVLIYFDAFCKNQKDKENALTKIKEISYAINRAKKREENQTTKKEYKQLTGYVPEVIREILNAMADENEMHQGELVVQWVIGELRNPAYARILERFKERLPEIEECEFPRRTKKVFHQPQASWLQNLANSLTVDQKQNQQSRMEFKNTEETPALFYEKNRKTDVRKETIHDTTTIPTEKTKSAEQEKIDRKAKNEEKMKKVREIINLAYKNIGNS